MPSIFKDKSVISSIPTYFEGKESPIICYKYNKPIRSNVFNYNKLFKELDIENSVRDSCHCKGSGCFCLPAGQIVMGDLGVITDSGVRSVVCGGPGCGFSLPIDLKSCRDEIAGALQEFCDRWCKGEHVESNALNSWKLNIFKIIDGRISFHCNN